ncbi:hypothetical protein AB3N60_01635 [Leptospira sp. WS39.C2]
MEENKEEILNTILGLEEKKLKIKNAIKSSGSILIFIGFLTLLNIPSIAYFGFLFPIGLYAPLFFGDPLAAIITDQYYYWLVFISIHVLIWVFFTYLSKTANNNSKIAFYVAFGIYAIDTILTAYYQEWFFTIFHLFFLYQIYSGYSRIDELIKLEEKISKIRSTNHDETSVI